MSENRREFFRVFLKPASHGKIAAANGEFMPIEIEDISVKGMKFSSHMDFLIEQKIQCSFTVLDMEFLIEGAIVRKISKNDFHEYGVGFLIDQQAASRLFKQLNYYQIRQRKGINEEQNNIK